MALSNSIGAEYYLGIDFGTSGARAIAIDEQRQVLVEIKQAFSQSDTRNLGADWQEVLYSLLEQIPLDLRSQLKAIAINGTSSTVLLVDETGKIVGEPMLYNDARGKECLTKIAEFAPIKSVVQSATSSLAKLLLYAQQNYFSQASYLLHQADWLTYLLHGKLGISDYHNALKLGYDVEELCYPNWLKVQDFFTLLPRIVAPGQVIGTVTQAISDRFSLPSDCLVCAGTTDSIAAFLASGVSQPGEAVTSLGSTLVLKLLSKTRVAAPEYGIYSHRLGDFWLVGGASNTGGAVLKAFFSAEELVNLSQQIDSQQPSNLGYYPLLRPGERFPINDPNLPPKLEPRPDSKVEFLRELLCAIARIEAQGYQKLQDLGATKLTRVVSAGGGANNLTWQQIRQNYLGVNVSKAKQTEAAYGTAVLALEGCGAIN